MSVTTPSSPDGPDATWFVDALARRLEELDDEESVVLWVDDRSGPCLRVIRSGDELLVDAESSRLDDAKAKLGDLGFQAPGASGGYFRLTGTRDRSASIATSISLALVDVFGVTDARLIGYRSGVHVSVASPTLSLIHDDQRLCVWAEYDEHGALRISGQDLGGFLGASEYEYFITIAADAFPLLRAAFDAPDEVDARALVAAYGPALVRIGEKNWLESHDIPHDFFNWY